MLYGIPIIDRRTVIRQTRLRTACVFQSTATHLRLSALMSSTSARQKRGVYVTLADPSLPEKLRDDCFWPVSARGDGRRRLTIYTSVCSAISRASSTSIPRYRTVLSSFV